MTQARHETLQERLGYSFSNPSLLHQALTHRSCSGAEGGEDNERLEFLGDAVLQLVVSEHLYLSCPESNEGRLAKTRSLLVSQPTLAEQARTLGLQGLLQVGHGEYLSGAHMRESLLCDAMEAVLGAVFLDGGFEAAKTVILDNLPDWDGDLLPLVDAKSTLQEHLQQSNRPVPVYNLMEARGPDHDKDFVVEVVSEGAVLGRGVGKSKKDAAQKAARQALQKLDLLDSF